CLRLFSSFDNFLSNHCRFKGDNFVSNLFINLHIRFAINHCHPPGTININLEHMLYRYVATANLDSLLWHRTLQLLKKDLTLRAAHNYFLRIRTFGPSCLISTASSRGPWPFRTISVSPSR